MSLSSCKRAGNVYLSGERCCCEPLVLKCHHRVTSDSYGQPAASAPPANQALEWRRSIYALGLWARPVGVPGSGGGASGGAATAAVAAAAAPGGERRLADWVTRELQALLEQEVSGRKSRRGTEKHMQRKGHTICVPASND